MSEPVLQVEKMALESRVAAENAASVTPGAVVGRRDAVREHGRSQTAD